MRIASFAAALVSLIAFAGACAFPIPECAVQCDATQHCARGTCGTDGFCHADQNLDHCTGVMPTGDYNIAFVTAATFMPGALGGIAGADQACNTAAHAANLSGTYAAWISDESTDAKSRFTTARGWVRPDGKPFVDTIAALTEQLQMFYPARLDEHGNDLAAPGEAENVATGTRADGTRIAGSTASNWSSLTSGYGSGQVGAAGHYFTEGGSFSGNHEAHLLCLGTDHNEALSPPKSPGRTAFVTVGLFNPALGIAAADMFCANEANMAGVTGDFAALLSTQTTAAADRFTGDVGWTRTDGIPWVEHAADLAAQRIASALAVTADGHYQVYNSVWTGSSAPGVRATQGADDCGDWSNASSTGIVGRGEDLSWYFDSPEDQPADCSNAAKRARLYCLSK